MIAAAPKYKESAEVVRWSLDAATTLPLETDEVVTKATFTVWRIPDDVDVTAVMAPNPPTVDGTTWSAYIEGGDDGEEFWMEWSFVTNLEQQREFSRKLRVRNLP